MWVAGKHWCEPRGFQRCKTTCEPNCESKMHCVDGRVCVDIYCSVGACSLLYCICLLQMQIQFLCICLVIWKGIWLAPSHLPFQSGFFFMSSDNEHNTGQPDSWRRRLRRHDWGKEGQSKQKSIYASLRVSVYVSCGISFDLRSVLQCECHHQWCCIIV